MRRELTVSRGWLCWWEVREAGRYIASGVTFTRFGAHRQAKVWMNG